MKHEINNFVIDVIQRSFQVPVVADFWADWCGPCKILGPVLERLAEENYGAWLLAKVDTEHFVNEAETYQIQSIPNVKLFLDRNVAAEFTGALPEQAVRQWLQKYLPDPWRRDLLEAERLLGSGDDQAGRVTLENILTVDPTNLRGRTLLAKSLVFTDPHRATELIGRPEDLGGDEIAEAVGVLAGILVEKQGTGRGSADGPASLYGRAVNFLRLQDFDRALATFIRLIRASRYYRGDAARKACIAIFKYLGEDHSVTLKHRRDFGSSLYA
jgi:putative thioredoxin